MKEKDYSVKAINYFCDGKSSDDCNVYLSQQLSIASLEDCAVFDSRTYKKIFDVERKNDCNSRKKLAILKIQNNGKKIYRQYLGSNFVCKGIGEKNVGLTPSSIRLLSDDGNSNVVGHQVNVSKGSRFMYYWFHPGHATRISFRLGFPALVLAIIAFVVSLIEFLL